MKDRVILPGTTEKRTIITALVAGMSPHEPNYLAYIGELKALQSYVHSHPHGLETGYLLHWAAGHPYQETLDELKKTISIEARVAIVNLLLQQWSLANSESSVVEMIKKGNGWGETVLHVSVASQNMSDQDTLLLFKTVLLYIPANKLLAALQVKNIGGATVLDYAKLLGKTATAEYIESMMNRPSNATMLSQGIGHFSAVSSTSTTQNTFPTMYNLQGDDVTYG